MLLPFKFHDYLYRTSHLSNRGSAIIPAVQVSKVTHRSSGCRQGCLVGQARCSGIDQARGAHYGLSVRPQTYRKIFCISQLRRRKPLLLRFPIPAHGDFQPLIGFPFHSFSHLPTHHVARRIDIHMFLVSPAQGYGSKLPIKGKSPRLSKHHLELAVS